MKLIPLAAIGGAYRLRMHDIEWATAMLVWRSGASGAFLKAACSVLLEAAWLSYAEEQGSQLPADAELLELAEGRELETVVPIFARADRAVENSFLEREAEGDFDAWVEL